MTSRIADFLFTRSIFYRLLICVLLFNSAGCKTQKTAKKEQEQPAYEIQFDEILVTANTQYKAEAEKIFDLLHVKLHVKPLWQQRALEATAELTLQPHAYSQDSLVLDAKSFNVSSVMLLMQKGTEKPLSFSYNNTQLSIKLDKLYKPGEKFEIKIEYVARPENQYALGILKSKKEQGLFFIDPDGTDPNLPTQMWSQGEVQNNSAWFPLIDQPNQKFTQELFITVDKSFKTLSNGALQFSSYNKDGSRTDYWHLNKPHAPYLAMIAAGKWVITEDTWRDSVPVEYYLEPEYSRFARKVFGNTPEMLEFYSDLLDYDYPWPKYSQVVVREFVSGAMENTSAVVHYDALQHDDRAHLDETYESIIAHELFHHWFGDLVTAESWTHLALNESLATYGERLWDEHKYGAEEAAFGRSMDLEAYLLEATYVKEPIVNYYYTNAENLFDHHRYEKGALILHMLRTQLGDEVFFKGLNIYLKENQYKTAEISNLRQAFEKASGKDLNWFFNQWFMQAGHPQLHISQKWSAGENKLWLVVEQKQNGNNIPTFTLPVEVHIYTPSKILKEKITLRSRKDSFAFTLTEAPLLVNFDAQKYLLCQKVEIKPLAQWYYQYFNAPLYMDRFEAVMALSANTALLGADSLKNLLNACLTDKFWNIRKRTLEALLPNCNAAVKAAYLAQVKNMALTDKDARVRVTALQYLEQTEAFSAIDIYGKALKDSSYRILAFAIYALQTHLPPTDTARFVRELAAYENLRSSDVIFSIANVYIKHPDPKRIGFFKGIPAHISSYEYGRFFEVLRKFFATLPAATLKQETTYLLSLRNKAVEIWSRMGYKLLLEDASEKLKKAGYNTEADQLQKMADTISLSAE